VRQTAAPVVRGKELLVTRPLRRVLKEMKEPVTWICRESVQAHVRNQGKGPTANVDVCTQGRTKRPEWLESRE